MGNSLTGPLQKSAIKWLIFQLVILMFIALLGSLYSIEWGVSALLGGMVAWLPNVVFTWYAFRFSGALHAKRVYDGFKRGAGLKFLLTFLLLALCFKLLAVAALPFLGCFFIGVILTTVAHWFLPIH